MQYQINELVNQMRHADFPNSLEYHMAGFQFLKRYRTNNGTLRENKKY